MTHVMREVRLPPAPGRGVYLTPIAVARVLAEWASLPDSVVAVEVGVDFGPALKFYERSIMVELSTQALRELAAAYKSPRVREPWERWSGSRLDHRDVPALVGLALMGTVMIAQTDHAKRLRTIWEARDVERVARAQAARDSRLEPVHLGNGVIDMTRLAPPDRQLPTVSGPND